MKIRIKLFDLLWLGALFVLLVYAAFWYLHDIRPWLMGFPANGTDEAFNLITADTYTYWFFASEEAWLSAPINLIGPVSLYHFLGMDFDLVVLFHVFLFGWALWGLYRYAGVRALPFAVIFLLNPSMMGQLFAINKEILIMISLLFAVCYVHSGKNVHFIAAVVIAAFSKPEFLALIMFYFGARRLRPERRIYILVAMITIISLIYPAIPNMAGYTSVLLDGQTTESLGITVLLQELAVNYYLYFGIILPRLLLDIYSGGFIYAPFLIFALIFAVTKKKIRLTDDVVFLFCLYLIMVSVVPFPQYRYILPAYPLLLIFIMQLKGAARIPSHIAH